jgi:glutamate-1-semialdehyde 2,1-aminomutase
MLCQRYPSVERLRFCCSGSEAVLFACRAARAWTGRPKILKQRGSYHGTTDAMEIDMPTSQRGIPPHAGADMLYADFWDEGEAEALLRAHRDELAGLLLNPIWFRREDGRLPRLVDIARANDVPVVCDEVMSFRFAPGGAQQYFGFEADITAFGKSIGGGGLAVGAFGGRAEIMRLFSNLDEESPVHHTGTFAGNPTTAAAGIAALEELTPALFERTAELGERLRSGFGRAFADAGIRATLLGEASLVLLFLGELSSLDPRKSKASPAEAEVKRLFGLSLLNKGMFTPADALIWAISEPMREAEVDRAVAAVRATLAELKPLFETCAPELLAG